MTAAKARFHTGLLAVSKPRRRYRRHELIGVEPAVKTMTKQSGSGVGFGAPAGRTLACACGYQTRSADNAEYHVSASNARLHAADPLGFSPVRHRAVAGYVTRSGAPKVLCSCGYATDSTRELASHITVSNWCANFESEA